MIEGSSYEALKSVRWVGTQEYRAGKPQAPQGNTLVYFKTTFHAGPNIGCVLTLSANNRYKLWVNGMRMGEGPCKGDRHRHFFDTVDIGAALVEGPNVIAVEVLYYSPSLYRDGHKSGPISVVSNHLGPLLAIGAQATGVDGRRIDLSTGSCDWHYRLDDAVCWNVLREDGYFMPVGAFEIVEGSLLPRDWRTSPSLDGSWQKAVAYYDADGSEWGEFSPLPARARPIPLMAHSDRRFTSIVQSSLPGLSMGRHCADIPANASFFVELDAGELCTGYLRLQTGGGKGSSVKVTYAESYSAEGSVQYRVKGRRDDWQSYTLHGFHDVFKPSSAGDAYEPFWWRTFRFVRVEVQTAGEPLRLFWPTYVATGYPLQELSSVMSEGCGWVEPLWRTSVRTLQLCMHETHEDCPYYEQVQYALDTRLQILFTYALGSDTAMARKAIADFHSTLTPEGLLYSRAPTDEPNIIPVFSLYWIMMLEDYYDQTADIGFVNQFRPTVDAILAWFDRRIDASGLVDHLYYWEFIDWVEDWQNADGYINGIPASAASGPCATTNLVYAAALDCAARLLAHSRPGTANEYAVRAQAIRHSAQERFWDEEKGMYREGAAGGEFTQHAQAFAVLCGLAKGERAARALVNSLTTDGVKECTYVFCFFLFRALEQTGLYRLTEGLWKKWTDALELGLTTWPEDLTRQRSDCHAWGSLPIYEFVRCFLGVQALEPGYEKILIQPACTYIGDMKGEVSTPKGPVFIQWRMEEGNLHLEGRTPAGVPAKVCGPFGGELWLDNGGVFQASFPATPSIAAPSLS